MFSQFVAKSRQIRAANAAQRAIDREAISGGDDYLARHVAAGHRGVALAFWIWLPFAFLWFRGMTTRNPVWVYRRAWNAAWFGRTDRRRSEIRSLSTNMESTSSGVALRQARGLGHGW